MVFLWLSYGYPNILYKHKKQQQPQQQSQQPQQQPQQHLHHRGGYCTSIVSRTPWATPSTPDWRTSSSLARSSGKRVQFLCRDWCMETIGQSIGKWYNNRETIGEMVVQWDLEWDLPSGNLLHNYGKIHHAING